jgi:hypothetical protein
MTTAISLPTTSAVTIKPADGRRLIVPSGCLSLDGVPIAPGADLPAAGAAVPRGMWAVRALGRGDAVRMTDDEVTAWKAAAAKAKADADAAAAKAKADADAAAAKAAKSGASTALPTPAASSAAPTASGGSPL